MNTTLRMTGLLVAPIVALILWPSVSDAAPDLASFESFYHQSWSMSPWSWALAAVGVIAAVVAVIVFTPAAGPVVAGVGTWIGGLFGFSGIAATNFGLALLGGGAVASGGFGILGGTALLTAAFTFGTDVVIDYASGKAIEAYQYERFVEASRQMTTLPLPRNKKGPDSYEKALKLLDGVNDKEALTSNPNIALIQKAIASMSADGPGTPELPDVARHESMLALLCFIADDYRAVKGHAGAAYEAARKAGMVRTLPAFLLGTSYLYDDTLNFKDSVALFQHSVREEPDNPLIPLLFAVFLDRMTYRINDGALSPRDLDQVAEVGDFHELGKNWGPVQVVLLSRYITQIKLEQQKIASLATSSNETIRNDAGTLALVKASLRDYEHLVERAHFLAGALSSPGAIPRDELPPNVRQTRTLVNQYSADRDRLRGLVEKLEAYQDKLRESRPRVVTAKSTEQPVGNGPFRMWWLVIAIASFVAGLLAGRGRTRTSER